MDTEAENKTVAVTKSSVREPPAAAVRPSADAPGPDLSPKVSFPSKIASWKETTREAVARAVAAGRGPLSVEDLHRELLDPGSDQVRIGIESFVALIEEMEEVWLVPSGEAVLAIPAGEGKAVLEGPVKFRLRSDVFSAFTTVREGGTWYLPEEDRMVAGSLHRSPQEGAVMIPQRSFRGELTIRQAFIEQLPQGVKRDLLADALDGDRPFAAFSKTLHRTSHVRGWHHFRFNLIFKDIRAWLAQNDLDWHPGWLEPPAARGGRSNGAASPAVVEAESADEAATPPAPPTTKPAEPDAPAEPETPRQLLARAIADLSSEELSRISIPADLVLAILEARR